MSVQESVSAPLSLSEPQTSPQPRLNSKTGISSQSLAGVLVGKTAAARTEIVLAVGVISAVLCVVWSVLVDVAYPIAVTAGVCVGAAVVCAYAALLVIRSTTVSKETSEVKSAPSAAWRVVDRFRIADASRLWCSIEPGCPASQESVAWAHAMLDAIKRGDLSISSHMGDDAFLERERKNPSWRTEIDRSDLAAWARGHGHLPDFLDK